MESWMVAIIVLSVVLAVILLIVISNIRIVKQTDKYVVTWEISRHLGRWHSFPGAFYRSSH